MILGAVGFDGCVARRIVEVFFKRASEIRLYLGAVRRGTAFRAAFFRRELRFGGGFALVARLGLFPALFAEMPETVNEEAYYYEAGDAAETAAALADYDDSFGIVFHIWKYSKSERVKKSKIYD